MTFDLIYRSDTGVPRNNETLISNTKLFKFDSLKVFDKVYCLNTWFDKERIPSAVGNMNVRKMNVKAA